MVRGWVAGRAGCVVPEAGGRGSHQQPRFLPPLIEQQTTYNTLPQIDHDALRFSSAVNDFCCHIAKVQKTVPLQFIQDVQLQT